MFVNSSYMYGPSHLDPPNSFLLSIRLLLFFLYLNLLWCSTIDIKCPNISRLAMNYFLPPFISCPKFHCFLHLSQNSPSHHRTFTIFSYSLLVRSTQTCLFCTKCKHLHMAKYLALSIMSDIIGHQNTASLLAQYSLTFNNFFTPKYKDLAMNAFSSRISNDTQPTTPLVHPLGNFFVT